MYYLHREVNSAPLHTLDFSERLSGDKDKKIGSWYTWNNLDSSLLNSLLHGQKLKTTDLVTA